MIEILTLFLGLISGQRYIELDVAEPVHLVELRLDDRLIETLDGPPWDALVDFGTELKAHQLIAIALDEDGEELDRTRMWINLALPDASANLRVVERTDERPSAVGIDWQAIGVTEIAAIEATFDGQPLPAADPNRIDLPAFDNGSLHVLSVEIRLPDSRVVRLARTFGGQLTDELDTELTAVVVERLEKSGRLRAQKMDGWLTAGGAAMPVRAVEKGPATLIIVRDPTAQHYFDRWAAIALPAAENGSSGLRPDFLDGGGGPGLRVHFLAPLAAPAATTDNKLELFPSLSSELASDQGLLDLLANTPPISFPMRLADAVAVGGMVAHASQQRRAVLLILGDTQTDVSHHQPAAVEAYLRQLQVPLYVWQLAPSDAPAAWSEVEVFAKDSRPPRTAAAARRLRSQQVKTLERAFRQLRQTLDRQQVVWLEGRHLPQSVELGEPAVDLALSRCPCLETEPEANP